MAHSDRVEAYYELTQAKAQYCYNLDARDWGALAELMTEDVEFDVGDGDPRIPVLYGAENAIRMLRVSLAGSRSVHQVHTPLIDLDGDEARVVWTMHDRVIWEDGRSRTGYGHYRERWVRAEREWKLASLRLTRLITDLDRAPVTIYDMGDWTTRSTADI
ncbi:MULTISPECIES: nuclear transport factor 2 family protein [Nocardia]|uniref:Nuclear transport factor 2 family protein n=1 Tax=Nocardia aurea TaxID=2144174 RepID=A0ABV3FTA0_9NOCA|nr:MULTISPECIES: nuclear transport factor 2 family protein [Nocardia]